MKDEIQRLLKRTPSPSAIDTVQKAMDYKKDHAEASKKLAKRLTDTELNSLYKHIRKWYS